ncbi:hypothetical protein ACFLT7_04670 [candidate division KSB1 bacterium]
MKPTHIIPAALLLTTVALYANSGALLFDDFEDISEWTVQWAGGPGYNLPNVAEGTIFGFNDGYGAPTAAMTRRIDLHGLRAFRLETRATASGSGSSQIQICLFSTWENDWSGYLLNIDGEDYIYPARVRLYRIDRHRPTILGTYNTFDVQRWETYKLERTQDGGWSLFMGRYPVPDAAFSPDTTYTNFNHLGIMLDTSNDKIDYLRLNSTSDN